MWCDDVAQQEGANNGKSQLCRGVRQASQRICELAVEGWVVFQAETSGRAVGQKDQLCQVPRCEGTAVGPQAMSGEEVPNGQGLGPHIRDTLLCLGQWRALRGLK